MTRLLDTIARWAAVQPDAPALAERDRTVSYRTLLTHIRREMTAEQRSPAAEWVIHPVQTDVDGTLSLLARLSAGHRLLLTDPTTSAAELALIENIIAADRPDSGSAGRPALGLVTSGTTGKPKVVSRDLAGAIANSQAFADTIGCYQPGQRVLCAAPFHHAYGLGVGLLASIMSGACLVPLARPLGGALAAAAERHQCAVCISVPFAYASAAASAARWPASVTHCISAGDRLTPQLSEQVKSMTGVAPINHYGCTECGLITLGECGDTETVGNLLPGITARTSAPDGTSAGALFVGMPAGYSRVLGAGTAAADADGVQWVMTGDRATLDRAGRVILLGRVDAAVTLAGEQVDLTEIEAAFGAHALVRACKVVAVGSPVERLVAYVEADGDLDELSLRRHLVKLLASYKVPSRISIVDELPRTRTGKIKAGLLRAAAEAS
jgi:acyl-coenzyme A synthetase/AMP-(fatty) acid ligase